MKDNPLRGARGLSNCCWPRRALADDLASNTFSLARRSGRRGGARSLEHRTFVKRDTRITMLVKLCCEDKLQLRGKEKPDCCGTQPPFAQTRFFPSALHRFVLFSTSG
ncbi:MAG TPA: hypothetical protein VGY31_11840 [Terriglobia bacterium]|nr:hypothetical protein [Terriglobia bacterium]